MSNTEVTKRKIFYSIKTSRCTCPIRCGGVKIPMESLAVHITEVFKLFHSTALSSLYEIKVGSSKIIKGTEIRYVLMFKII